MLIRPGDNNTLSSPNESMSTINGPEAFPTPLYDYTPEGKLPRNILPQEKDSLFFFLHHIRYLLPFVRASSTLVSATIVIHKLSGGTVLQL